MKEIQFTKKVANTTYVVKLHFNNQTQQTLKDKIIKMIKETKYRK